MEIEIIIALIILFALVFLATVDLAFSQISDVGLRRLATESEENQNTRAAEFLREILENRSRFRFAISSAIQVLVIIFTILVTLIVSRRIAGDQITNQTQLFGFSLFISLLFSVAFRQILPRILISKNTEKKLMFLLPLVRPLYMSVTLFAAPFALR